MTLRIRAFVSCCNNQAEHHFRTVSEFTLPMGTADPDAVARAKFTADGWTCEPGKPDYCPDCSRRREVDGTLTATRK